jgi:hypothetical protein
MQVEYEPYSILPESSYKNNQKKLQTTTVVDISHYFIIVSHHGRIRCFLNQIASCLDSNHSLLQSRNRYGNKFILGNAAVVQFTYIPSKITPVVIVECIYEGFDRKSRNLWTDKTPHKIEITKDSPLDTLFKSFSKPFTKPVSFFMVRHGFGLHNSMSTLSKFFNPPYDPLLIDIGGIDEASNRIFTRIKGTPYTLCSSPLRRCIETLLFLLFTCPVTQSKKLHKDKITIYILPCLHEFVSGDVKSNGKCDTLSNDLKSSQSRRWYEAAENTSICLNRNKSCKTIQQTFLKEKYTKKEIEELIDKIHGMYNSRTTIDWYFFEKFKQSSRKCPDDSFLHYVSELPQYEVGWRQVSL